MPDRESILLGLSLIANRASAVAIFWHAVLAALAAAMWLGLRPSGRALALGVSAALGSVALCALLFANPFNALLLGASALTLALLAVRAQDNGAPAMGTRWTRVLGALLLAFGWVYPHFLEGPSLAYLYAAPLGTLPCPTLSASVGMALLGSGLVGRAWSRLLAGVAAFYGLFGALRLGVTIDLVLLAGAVGVFAQSVQARHTRRLRAV
jgi:hypothetical protein